jgi:hypothetical protein
MFQIPHDAAVWTLTLFVPICIGVFVYIGYRKKKYFRWIAAGITTTLLLFIPTCAGVCYLIEPLYTHEGKVPHSSDWDTELNNHRYHWVDVPSNATDIIYFKNTAREYFSCRVSPNNFIKWCESYNMSTQSHFRVSYKDLYSSFCNRGVSNRDDYIAYETKMAPHGSQMRAIYYPSSKLMYYEKNYW